ncbi:flagellar export protein FliJ [Idiomarina xiamenensis]|uniref:Flagellar FliJ protein n=1 Tax=Idiomarina xiamenensis 10-D-4 TaxID=740709 RepID=K2JYL8_9GAMM|nr:flagellar export protein FliJ [Idiomarina xiamenensis]EKE80513.1 flagellar biosynthesis chaperone [Idiomarina xiamenensis 10-D-4]
MADMRALQMLLELEQRREDKAAAELAQVRQTLQQQQQRLQGMEQYRLQYLQQLQQRGNQGLHSHQFGQYHAFVGKLDAGVEQIHASLSKLQQVVEQRQQRWFAQRRKRQSVEHLLEQQRLRQQREAERREQKLMDEFNSNKFARIKQSG